MPHLSSQVVGPFLVAHAEPQQRPAAPARKKGPNLETKQASGSFPYNSRHVNVGIGGSPQPQKRDDCEGINSPRARSVDPRGWTPPTSLLQFLALAGLSVQMDRVYVARRLQSMSPA